jgi:hypothetical protein
VDRRPERYVVSGNKFCAEEMDLFKQGNEQTYITTGNVRRVPTGKFPWAFPPLKNHSASNVEYWTRGNKLCISPCKQQISHYHNLRTALAPFKEFKDKNYPYPIGPTYKGSVVKENEYPPGKFWCEVEKGDSNDQNWDEHITYNRNTPVRKVYWDYCSLDKKHTISGFVSIKLSIP